ncbi:Ribosomal lysine N-methyltransferase 4 [Conoideocrella luteorostrata]|uniref:Ribosomal lysine N-methyltransferase 4 n=1 Tax=Conoideocrella luteorostrata TaxID=1105319 RepID=A0AAJ0D215_9HYPO|nr:Ribosomal lysine N-methyltransferase 4 [Conoideocrella luteorostrata]
MSSTDFNSETTAFLQWFKALPGATFSDAIDIVDLRSRGAGRGIVATRDIPADTTLFTLPRNAILNSETSGLRKTLPALFTSNGDEDDQQALDSWSALILIMMYEFFLGDQSKWKPYIDVLPATFDTPMFWSEEELSNLQASATVNKIGKANAEELFRTHLLPAIRNNPAVFASSEECSDNDLINLAHRMGSTIMAYAFDMENDEEEEDDESDGWVEDREGKSMMGMVAMADILNADAEFNAHVNHGNHELTVTALRDIKAGDEILNYYGPHPNSELLRRYGYVTDKHSRYDVVEIPWEAVQNSLTSELSVSQEVMEKAMESIDEEDFEDTFVLERESGEPNSDGTFGCSASLDGMPLDLKEQLKTVIMTLQKLDGTLIPDKRKRDDVLSSTMTGALRSISSQYGTTVAEDEQLLKQDGLPHRQRMAIRVRLGEKRLIQEAFEAFSGKAAQDMPDAVTSTTKRVRRTD